MRETQRRREIQTQYNKEHGITPRTIKKAVHDVIEISTSATPRKRGQMTKSEKKAEIARLTRQMKEAARMLEFELAAQLRDQIKALESQ